jgi:hypothetical protein
MQSPVSRLIALMLLLAYSVTSIGPRGAALCLGGGHEWNEVIAARCAHGGHSHDGQSDHGHEPTDCTACGHHQDADHGPCTDIPLDADEARPGGSQSTAKATIPFSQDTSQSLAWSLPDQNLPMLNRPPERCREMAWVPREVTASLRATILLI